MRNACVRKQDIGPLSGICKHERNVHQVLKLPFSKLEEAKNQTLKLLQKIFPSCTSTNVWKKSLHYWKREVTQKLARFKRQRVLHLLENEMVISPVVCR